MTRNLRPVVLAGFAGTLLALFGAQLGGLTWMLGRLHGDAARSRSCSRASRRRGRRRTVSVGTTILGAGWIGLGLGHLILLRDIPEHAQLATLTVVLAVFAGDTAAYFAGRLFGRHKLAPLTRRGRRGRGSSAGRSSPSSSRSSPCTSRTSSPTGRRSSSASCIAIAAPVGDLFESAIKRDMHVKDTGTLLAGHGGMLDRIDAQLFAVVASFYVLVAYGVDVTGAVH